MHKLVTAYRAAPTLKLAAKIRTYVHTHPMSRCLIDATDNALVTVAINHANREGAE